MVAVTLALVVLLLVLVNTLAPYRLYWPHSRHCLLFNTEFRRDGLFAVILVRRREYYWRLVIGCLVTTP